MKTLLKIIPLLLFLFISCQNKELDFKTAENLIITKYKYPTVIDFEVFCSDPIHARRMLDFGLEEKGLVKIMETREFKDRDKPLIEFTAMSKYFLLETTLEERESKIQKVKIGTRKFDKIILITAETSDNRIAVAEYNVKYDMNAFGVLWPGLPAEKKEKAYFIFSDNGWQIIEKKDAELMMLKKIMEK
ncbi:hypothetical protein [Flavobacterium gelatinilyticum]|uniref:hypothetical protein n=1 Tax=Flavobacterium gelatinilyticum TaxID=3003260 RepID=UPI0024816744|nr:hypothetical protein [Flavobacterium gelatinilyticum]